MLQELLLLRVRVSMGISMWKLKLQVRLLAFYMSTLVLQQEGSRQSYLRYHANDKPFLFDAVRLDGVCVL